MAALVGMSIAVGCDGKGFDPTKDPPKMQAVQGASLVENRSVLAACLNGTLKDPPTANDLALIFGPPGTDLTKDLTRNGVPDDADALACGEILGDKSAFTVDAEDTAGDSYLDVLARSNVSEDVRDNAHFLRALLHWRKFIQGIQWTECKRNILSLQFVDPVGRCQQDGYATCAIETSRSLDRVQSPETFEYAVTRLEESEACGIGAVNLNGFYDAAALRGLGVISSSYAAMLHFGFTHTDLSRILTTLNQVYLKGGFQLPAKERPFTASEWLSLVEVWRPLISALLETPLTHPRAGELFNVSREASIEALRWWTWVWGPWLPSHPKAKDAVGFPLTWEDRDRSGKLDACDTLHLNVGSNAEAVVRLIFNSGVFSIEVADIGCPDVPPETIVLPKFMFGREIDYEKVAAAAGVLLSALRDHLASSEGTPLTSKHLNPLSTAIGWPTAEDTFELFPRVLFEKGLSVFLPARDAAGRFAIEAEINEGMPSDTEARADLAEPLGEITTADPFVCRGKTDWSANVTRGDGPHFGGAVPADHISVSEARLDLDGATEKNPFRIKRGGGFLPYVRFADPTLGGLIRVAPEFTRALTDPAVPVCDRTLSIPRAGDSAFGPTDDFSANVLLGTYVMQFEVCYDFLKEVMCFAELPEAGIGVTTPANAPPTTPVSGNPPTIQCDPAKSLWPLTEGNRWDLWAMIPFGEKQWPAAALSFNAEAPRPGVPGTATIDFRDSFGGIPGSCCAEWFVSEKPFGLLIHGSGGGFLGGSVIPPKPGILFPAPGASRPLKDCAGWKLVEANTSVAAPAGNFQGAIRYRADGMLSSGNEEIWLCPGVGPVEIYFPGQRIGFDPFVPDMDLPPLLLREYSLR